MRLTLALFFFLALSPASQGGNKTIDSFYDAKKILTKDVYKKNGPLSLKTIYCHFPFQGKKIMHVQGLKSAAKKLGKRATRLEWEHIVPASLFGHHFKEWKEGHPSCRRKKKSFKGRKCASKASDEFKKMEADMYNLYPSIGEVNKKRSNFPMTEFSSDQKKRHKKKFLNCNITIEDNQIEPTDSIKGIIARTYLYMDSTYHHLKLLSQKEKDLFKKWHLAFPVTEEECTRGKIIETIQKNSHKLLKESCLATFKKW